MLSSDELTGDPVRLTPFGAGKLLTDEWESNEPELDSDLHRQQIELLLACLYWWWRERRDFYATGNLTIFYNPDQQITRDFRGPDFFVVLGVDPRPRKSWMVWRENYRFPNLIIELLSDSTARVDRQQKRQLYQDTFKTPEYFWFDPWTARELEGLRLINGIYQPIQPNEQGWLWSEPLELFLGITEGKLRFFSPTGELVLTEAEAEKSRAEWERNRAERERNRAERAERELEQLRQRLRDLEQGS